MEAVHNLGYEITIILIAHRRSAVKGGDAILSLEKGELKALGAVSVFTQSSEQFCEMTASV